MTSKALLVPLLKGRWSFASVAFLGLLATPLTAQVIVPPQADISRQRVAPLPLPDPLYDLQILSPEKSTVPRAVDEIEFAVTRIKITGSTVFADRELAKIFKSLEGRRIVLNDLRKATDELESRYRAKGYFLTRVFIPPQTVEDGSFEVRVVEGFIGDVFAEAPNKGSRALALGIVGPVREHKPVRLVELESPLLLLNDMPGITATGVLRQGTAFGSSDLALDVRRRKTQAYATVSNFASNEIGPVTYSVGANIGQPLGAPGALDIALSGANVDFSELQSFNARYAMPIGRKGIVATLGGVVANALPGGEISALDVRSRSLSGTLRLRFPLYRSRAHTLVLDTGFTLNRSRVSALDVDITNDRSSIADVAINWRQVGWLRGDMNVRVAMHKGLLVLGANRATAAIPSVRGFNPEFTRFTYVVQRNQPLVGPLSAGLVVQGQHSNSRLLAGEQLFFGGNFVGRGYDPAQLVGDRGIGALGELRFAVRGLGPTNVLDNVQLYGFGDWARAIVLPLPGQAGERRQLASLGAGARVLLFKHLFLDGQFASARKAVSDTVPRGERVNVSATLLF